MAQYNLDWDDLGRTVQDIVDRAVNAQDYQKLNQTIRQVVDRAVDVGSDAVRKVVDSSTRSVQSRETAPRPVQVQKSNLPVLYGSTGGKTAVGVLKIVGGGILSAFSLMLFFTSLVIDVLLTGSGSWLFPAVVLGLFGGGAGLIGSGVSGLNRLSRFRIYCRTLGQKTYCTLERLAQSVGKNEKFVRREVQKMIGDGLFREGHLDKEETQLITSHETYHYFERSRLQLEQRKQEEAAIRARREAANLPPQVQDVLDKGNAFIREIRRCNDAIPGEEISRKIDRMETIVRRIFERAEAHPEIVPDLKKMMHYYLPMTVKLLNAYVDMDAQPVQGENISNSKREIEDTLDTLNLAFEKLLDSVFEDTALDISSDISVLNTLLAQEGLTEDDFSKMKNQQK